MDKYKSKGSYGEEHKLAKEKRLQRIDPTTCELSGRPIERDGQMHHIVTRLQGGPDHESNYRHTKGNIHQRFIHGLCDVDNPEVVRSRIIVSRALMKHILDDQKREHYHEKIRELDLTLICGYIRNMLDNLPEWLRDNVLYETLVSNYETVRDQKIEIEHLKAQQEEMKQKLREHGLLED